DVTEVLARFRPPTANQYGHVAARTHHVRGNQAQHTLRANNQNRRHLKNAISYVATNARKPIRDLAPSWFAPRTPRRKDAPMEYDLIVRNGTVIDGSGAPRFRSDIAVKDGRIAAVIEPGESAQAASTRELDARGMIVAPGFIDLHSHSDWIVPIPEHAAILKPFLMQGVTTFVGGNCGFSVAPISRSRSRMLDESGQMLSGRKFDWTWQEVSEFGAHLERQGLALNVAHLAGHGSIRLCVMGANPGEPSAEQLREMQAMLERAMADGAVGLSTGLGYFPGMIAKPAELTAMAQVAAAAGGVLTSHLRAYSTRSLFYQS